jgi:hypothetical protein
VLPATGQMMERRMNIMSSLRRPACGFVASSPRRTFMGRSLRQDAFVSTRDRRVLQQSQGGRLITATPSCGRQDAYRPHSQDGCATFSRDRMNLFLK